MIFDLYCLVYPESFDNHGVEQCILTLFIKYFGTAERELESLL